MSGQNLISDRECTRAAFSIRAPLHIRLANWVVASRRLHNTKLYIRAIGEAPNYIEPTSFSEKMQYRKMFDRNPLFRIFCDKLEARNYAQKADCGLKFPQIYFSGDDPNRIPFEQLPVPYIIKPNHSSGPKYVVRERDEVNKTEILALCRHWLQAPYGQEKGEWGYRDVHRQIMVEELLSAPRGTPFPEDYKLMVFSGRVACIRHGRNAGPKDSFSTFFDPDWKRMPVRKWVGWKNTPHQAKPCQKDAPRPKRLEEMVAIAERLAGDIDHLRVDLYAVGDEIVFGELTPYDDSGFAYPFIEDARYETFPPRDLDYEYGQKWRLPKMSMVAKVRHVLVD